MKKFIALLVAIMVVGICIPMICQAEETESEYIVEGDTSVESDEDKPETEADTETVGEGTEAEEETPGEGDTEETANVLIPETDENQTLTGRLWQYVCENKSTVISTGLDIVLIVLYYLAKKTKSKKDDEIVNQLLTIRNDAATSANGQTTMTEAVNGLIEGYNTMSEKYTEQEANEENRNEVSAAVLTTNMTILEILQTVYKGSKNLPQGTKDLIDYKYAKCLQELESNDSMKALVDMVKTAIKTTTSEESTEDTKEE